MEGCEYVIGFISGIITNLISWFILFHCITPEINFSPSISKLKTKKTPSNRSRYKYRVKIENSRKRKIIDVEIMARLRFKGLGDFPKTNYKIVYIPLHPNQNIYKIPQLLKSEPGRARRHVLILHVNNVDEFRTNILYPKEFREKAKKAELQLEDLLNLGTKANIQMVAFGYDNFSGTRKVFHSEYKHANIQEGTFGSKGLNVKEVQNEYKPDIDIDLEDDNDDQ